MQQKPNEVETWAPAWWHNRREDLRRSDRTISVIGNQPPYCLLCEQPVPWGPEARDKHHRQHMVELDAWRAGKPPEPTDSDRRARSRRAQRRHEIERALALGEDPYLYAVEGIHPANGHRKRRRRLRHPKAETENRILDLHRQGLMRPVIAERMRVSEDYVRRVLKRLHNQGGVPQNGASNRLPMRPLTDIAVHPRESSTGGEE